MKIFAACYALILGFHLYVGANEWLFWTNFSKPFLLGSLVVFVGIAVAKNGTSKFALLTLFGLIASLIGDIFLIYQELESTYFIAGLACFLLAHVAYTWAFSMTYVNRHVIPLLKRQGWVMILIVAYGMVFFNALRPHLGDMAPAVMLYTLAITAMLLLAANREGRVEMASFGWIAFGALCFVISDSALAWNKFVRPVDHAHMVIMGTYGLAQFGITFGAVHQIQDTRKKKK